MSATYHRSPNPADRELVISQRSLAFVSALVALLGSLFSAGIAYGVMRAQLDGKVGREEHREDLRSIDRRITRDSSIVQTQAGELIELKETAERTERRVTDIACDLIRPRRPYCR